MAEPLHTLTVSDLAEVSFVDAGDNPDAGVLLMKARPAPSTPSPEKSMPDGTTDPDIAKRDDEIQKLNARIALFEKAQEISVIKERIAPHLDSAFAPDLYEIGKTAPDAAKRIEAEMLRLAKAARAADAHLTARNGGAGAIPAPASDRLEKAIKPLMEKGMTRAAAVLKACEADPSIYSEMLEARN